MIRFPDGTDRIGDEGALAGAAGTRREQIPDAAAEIGAAQERVRGEREQDHGGKDGGQRGIRHVKPLPWR